MTLQPPPPPPKEGILSLTPTLSAKLITLVNQFDPLIRTWAEYHKNYCTQIR